MKHYNNKDRFFRLNYNKIELERIRLKAIFCDAKLPLAIKQLMIQKIFNLSKKGSLSRAKNRCIITSIGKSTYKDFCLNRSTLREYFSCDLIPGLRKSSW